jgi:hypothetical protein
MALADPSDSLTYLKSGTYVACYETMTNTKRITSEVLRRMCLLPKQAQTNYT